MKHDSRTLLALTQWWTEFISQKVFVLKFHLIICFHFRLQQFCHLWMFSHLLVNITSAASVERDKGFCLILQMTVDFAA